MGILSYTTYTLTYIAYLSVPQRDAMAGVGDVGCFVVLTCARAYESERQQAPMLSCPGSFLLYEENFPSIGGKAKDNRD